MIPRKVNVSINVSIPIKDIYSSSLLEYLQREFKDDEIENKIEEDIRDKVWNKQLWDFIPDNRIKISFE